MSAIDRSDGDNQTEEQADFFSSMLCFCLLPPQPTTPAPSPDSENYLLKLLEYEYSRTSNDRFNYLRCLEPADRLSFQMEMANQIEKKRHDRPTQEAIIRKGGMKMRFWRSIMREIKLVATYKLWRAAYWGEDAGCKTIVRKRSSNYHHLVEQYDGSYGSSMVVHVLFSYNEIYRTLELFISPARWCNEEVSIWEEECD